MSHDDALLIRIETTHERMNDLLKRASALPEEHRELFLQAAEELAAALEELHVASEELSQQAEELVTARRQAEEDRERYQELFYYAPEGYLVTDDKAVIQEANAAAAAMLGNDPLALTGKPLVLFVERDEQDSFYRQLRRLAETDRLEGWELDLKPRKRPVFPVSINVTALKSSDGRPEGLRWLMRDITEQRKHERQAMLASFPELNPDPIVETDIRGRSRYANPAARRLFPDLEGDGAGHPWLAGIGAIAAELLKSGKESASREVRRDGRWFEQYIFLAMEGSLVRIYGHDITERRAAEEALRKVHEELESRVEARTAELHATLEALRRQADRYTSMLTATADGFWIHDLDGRFVDVNDTYCRMSGYTRDEILSLRVTDIEAGESADEVARHIQAVAASGFDRFDSRHRRKNGEIYDVEVSASFLRGSNQVLVFARDITEQKRVREERLRLAAAVAQASEAIALTDADGRVIYVNAAFLELHALARPEALGRNYEDLIRADIEDEAFRARLREMRRLGETWKARLTRRMADGVERKLEATLSAVRDASGRILNYAAIESNVTQEHNLELYVRQLQKMEALGTLAGGIAHDFNNILVPIFLNTEMGLLETAKGSPLFGYLSLVLEATNRGRDLVRQIISFSRQKEQKRGPVDIVHVVREALKLLRSSTPATIALREHILAERAFVRADPTQIHQVVMNIGSNAAYAMREAGGELEVGLSEVIVDAETAAENPDLRPGPYVKLFVRDTGSGMTPEVMSKAFDPFFSTKKPGEGAGMGLAVVLGIVKSHGGTISAVSEPGKGTMFFIFLPQVEELSAAAGPPAGSIEPGRGRILFVDDEDILQRTVPRALERLGYQVTTAQDAHQALAIFRRSPEAFDLVITDQTMPRMTGEKLAVEMLRVRPRLPILLCTGFSEVIHEDEAMALGIAGFILKPFSIGEIAEKIQLLLEPEKTG